MSVSLDQLQVGEKAVVQKILVHGGIKRRLQDIGMIEGTTVQCLQKSPFGDPVAYLIRGAAIALREEDSNCILVQYN